MSKARSRYWLLVSASLLCLLITPIANAQHESGGGPTMGGGTIGGSTSRPASTKTTRTTTVRHPKTTTPPKKTTTTAKGPDADYYNKQGDEMFTAKNYNGALE